MLKVFSPKKSIFNIPTDSIDLPSNWVTSNWLSFWVAMGMYFFKSSGPMITPQAWVPVCLTEPSKILAYSITF